MKNPLKKSKEEPRRRVNRSSEVSVNKYISPRNRKKDQPTNKRKAGKRRRALIQLLLILSLLIGISSLLWTSSRVTEVYTPKGQEKYQQYISNYIHRNPISNFKPFITEQGITNALLEEFPEVESAKIQLSFFGPSIYVDTIERQAQLVLKTKDGKYFIVDRAGFAYETYDPSNPNDKAVILSDDTDVQYDLSTNRYLPSGLVEFVEATDAKLKSSNKFPDQTFSYRITDEARVIFVKPSGQKYEIKMAQDRPVNEQIYSLIEALDFYKSKSIKPSSYIDVRVNGTVYYK